MSKDSFGDRMKGYERDVPKKLSRNGFAYMRIDGRSFSKFTKKLAAQGLLAKPRDLTFEQVFVHSTIDIIEQFNFAIGFHQSDEISLLFRPLDNEKSQYPFDGKVQKLCSVIASAFTTAFIKNFHQTYGFIPDVSFDARVVDLPTKAEAVNMLVWRYKDAKRNVIQDYAYNQFSDKQLHKKSTTEKWEMIGKPELRPGNFIKRFSVEENGIIRHHVIQHYVNFDKLTWEQRVKMMTNNTIFLN